MKEYKITEFDINHLGLFVTISYSYNNPENSVSRVFFISHDAVSRHCDLQNLKDCLDGNLSFRNDAFIFLKDRAISEINHNILNADNITQYQKNVLNEYIEYLKK